MLLVGWEMYPSWESAHPTSRTNLGLVSHDVDAHHIRHSSVVDWLDAPIRAKWESNAVALPSLLRQVGVLFSLGSYCEADVPPINPLQEIEDVAEQQIGWERFPMSLCPPFGEQCCLALPSASSSGWCWRFPAIAVIPCPVRRLGPLADDG